jgi:putative hemolysin
MLVLLPTAALIKWILLGTLLLASALISGAEVAFFSLTPSVIEQAKESEPKRTEKIERLLKQPKRLLATILVANNFINIAIVLLFANLSNSLLSGVENELTQLFIEVVVITFIILLFGEILPKIYANRNNLSFAQFMAGTIYALDAYFLFYLTRPMSYVTHVLEKRFGQRSSSFSVDELSQAL